MPKITRQKKGLLAYLVFASLVLASVIEPVRAGTVPQADVDEAVDIMQGGALTLGRWFAGEMGSHFGFSASSGDIVPAPILGMGRVRVTVGLGVTLSKLDVDALQDALTEDMGDFSEIPNFIPVPLPQVSIRAGLPSTGQTDLALRWGMIPRLSFGDASGGASFLTRMFGITARQKVVGGGILPSLTLELGMSRASGEIVLTAEESEQQTLDIFGTDYDQQTTVNLQENIGWGIYSWSMMFKFSKSLPGFQPWVGAGRQWYRGSTDVRVTSIGSLSLTEVGMPSNTVTEQVSVTSTAKLAPKNGDYKLLLGFWLGGGAFSIVFQAESSLNRDHAAFAGLSSGF